MYRACESEDGTVLLKGQPGCRVEWPGLPKFRTGRKDCQAGGEEPWYAGYKEVKPNSFGNGPETVDFYKKHFGLTAREAIALQEGAHSLGSFQAITSGFVYQWTRDQTSLFNNQQLKHIANQPVYFQGPNSMKTGGKGTWLIGNATGQPAESKWQYNSKFKQWFLLQDRCPGFVSSGGSFKNNDCSVINDDSDPDPAQAENHAKANEACCTGLEPGWFCQPECQVFIFSDQTSLNCDVGFYYHFETDEEDGTLAVGCDGLGGKKQYQPNNCAKEEYAPEGEPLYQIVEEQAQSNVNMMKDFAPALEKMIENGYQDGLTDEVPAEWYMHVVGF